MAKSFQDRIKDLEDYRPNITYKDGAFILKIKLNKNWQIISPKSEKVAYAKDEKIPDLHWYVSAIEDSDELFDLIDETIAINKEFEKKSALYKEKVKELQELFLSDISYEKLKLVQFVIQDKETKPKAKKTTNKVQKEKQPKVTEEEPVVPEEITEEKPEVEVNNEVDEPYSGDIDDAIEKALGEK